MKVNPLRRLVFLESDINVTLGNHCCMGRETMSTVRKFSCSVFANWASTLSCLQPKAEMANSSLGRLVSWWEKIITCSIRNSDSRFPAKSSVRLRRLIRSERIQI